MRSRMKALSVRMLRMLKLVGICLLFQGGTVLLGGCAGSGYLQDRALDLADCFKVAVAAGPELSADLKATDALHLAVGGGVHGEAGFVGRKPGAASMMTLGLPVAPFMEEGILYGRYVFDECFGDWKEADVQDECYALHFLNAKPTNPRHRWVEAFDLEAGAIVLVGGRIGFSPGQFADFLAGWFGADPAGDDAGK